MGMEIMDKAKRPAFTVVELLVVIAIISILFMMLLPVLKNARRLAYLTVCQNNAKQVWYATEMYGDDNRNVCLPAVIYYSAAPTEWITWDSLITPYLGSKKSLTQLKNQQPNDNSVPRVFRCPATPKSPVPNPWNNRTYRLIANLAITDGRAYSAVNDHRPGHIQNPISHYGNLYPLKQSIVDGNTIILSEYVRNSQASNAGHFTGAYMYAPAQQQLDAVWSDVNNYYPGDPFHGPSPTEPIFNYLRMNGSVKAMTPLQSAGIDRNHPNLQNFMRNPTSGPWTYIAD